MAQVTIHLLKKMNFNFTVDEKDATNEYAVLRTKFQSSNEVYSFIEKVEIHTKTNFIIRSGNHHPTRFIFHKRWICQHSRQTKSKKNVGCQSFIDVLIKKVNRHTIKNDKFLKVPLPCLIKINLEHSHSTEDAAILRKLRVTPNIIKEFEEYFKSGLSVCEARVIHANRLIAAYDHSILSNPTFNPTDNQVYYMHNKWKAENILPISELKEKWINDKNRAGGSIKRRKLKRTATPSCNLPTSSESESNVNLENDQELTSLNKTPISEGMSEDKLVCLQDEIDSDESTGNYENESVGNETSLSSIDDMKEDHIDTSPNIVQLSVMKPDSLSTYVNEIEHNSKNLRKHTEDHIVTFPVAKHNVNSDFDYSVFKSSSLDTSPNIIQLSVVKSNYLDTDANAIKHNSESLSLHTEDCTEPHSTGKDKENSEYSVFKYSSLDTDASAIKHNSESMGKRTKDCTVPLSTAKRQKSFDYSAFKSSSVDASPNIIKLSVNAIDNGSESLKKHTQNCTTPLSVAKNNDISDFDYSIFHSSPDDSKETLIKKLDTLLSVNTILQKKVEFYQGKCKMYEKEVNILKDTIDNLKQMNPVTFDN